jgi:transposase
MSRIEGTFFKALRYLPSRDEDLPHPATRSASLCQHHCREGSAMQGEVSMNQQEATKRRRERTPNNRTTTGYRISDELWEVLQPLLPTHVNTHRFGGGRPRVTDRDCAEAIFYVLRTGCQWQALDQTELCSHSTAHDRFQERGETQPARPTGMESQSAWRLTGRNAMT